MAVEKECQQADSLVLPLAVQEKEGRHSDNLAPLQAKDWLAPAQWKYIRIDEHVVSR